MSVFNNYLSSCLNKTASFGSFDCYQFIRGFYPQLPHYQYTNLGEIKKLCIKHKVKTVFEQFRKDFKQHGFILTKNRKEGNIVIYLNHANEEALGFTLKSGFVIGVGETGLTRTHPDSIQEIWECQV